MSRSHIGDRQCRREDAGARSGLHRGSFATCRLSLGHVCALAALLMFFATGCAREERVVNYKPFFAGLSGAQMQTQPVTDGGSGASGGVRGAALASDEDLFRAVIENPDGSKTLQSKTGSQLMYHIQSTLMDNERDLFVEQILSEVTRREYAERGLDPGEAFDRLKKHERDIAKLFSRMPMGENSPNVIMEPLGANMFRLRLTGPAARDVRYRGFDMVLEGGNWRLRWFR